MEIYLFELFLCDIVKFILVKVVIYFGFVDEWVKKFFEGIKVKIFRVFEGIEFVDSDFYIWILLRFLKKIVRNIEYVLISLDLKNKSYY